MPEPFTMFLLAVLSVTIIGVAVAFWGQILTWAEESLFPWLKTNIPPLEKYAREAFTVLDNQVTAIKKAVKQAWEHLRKYLLHQTIRLERLSHTEWLKRVTSWIIVKLESGAPVTKKVEREEVVPWEFLPQDVREAYLRNNITSKDVNVTETRDRELETVVV